MAKVEAHAPKVEIRAVDPEFVVVDKEIKRMRDRHQRDPTLHTWTPIRTATFGGYAGSKGEYQMQIGCPCGATIWIPARVVDKW